VFMLKKRKDSPPGPLSIANATKRGNRIFFL
jgi:hypothetical protein